MNKSLKLNAVLNIVRQSLTILFPLLTFPYVSRVLGTEEFGRYSFSLSIVSYFQLFAAFGISTFAIREASAIRDDKKKVSELSSDLFTFNCITCTIAYAVLILLTLSNSHLFSYRLLIGIQSLCMTMSLLGLDWVNNVYEDFLYITVRYIVIQIIALAAVFVFVKSSADTAVYCFIILCGSYGGNIVNLIYIRKYIGVPRLKPIRLKRYLIPLSVLFVNSLATTIYVNSDVTVIGFFLGDTDAGLYSFASKIYNILKYFINAAIIVTIPRLGALVDKDWQKYDQLIEKTMTALMTVILPINAGVFVLSRQIIMIAGGSEYIDGHLSLSVLSFSLVFALFASVCTNCVLILQKKEKRVLASTVISASVNLLLNMILIPYIGIIGAAITTVIAECMNMIIQFYYVKKETAVSVSLKKRDIVSALLGVPVVIGVCCMFAHVWTDNTLWNSTKVIFASVFLAGLLYLIILIVLGNSLLRPDNRKYIACIVGHLAIGYDMNDGQTVKTRNIAEVLRREYGDQSIAGVDTYGGIRSIFRIIAEIIRIVPRSDNVIVMPAENGIKLILPLCLALRKLYRFNILYVVVGGWLPGLVDSNGIIKNAVVRVDAVFVESVSMKSKLEEFDICNAYVMPNFKLIRPLEEEEIVTDSKPFRLCTFSRVMKEKGIEIAVDAVKELNNGGNLPEFYLDIYGVVVSGQSEWFERLRSTFPDYVEYKGEVDSNESVNLLKNYHAVLFPTYYAGEGIAGTIIDALFSGVPVIASDWKYNSEIVTDMETGIILDHNDSDSLVTAIRKSCDIELWSRMKKNCISAAKRYTGDHAVSILKEKMK